MGVRSWEIIGWNEDPNGDGNIAFSLSETQVKVMFQALGMKIIEDEKGTSIHHFTDKYLQQKYLNDDHKE